MQSEAKNELGKISSLGAKRVTENFGDFKKLINALYIDPIKEDST